VTESYLHRWGLWYDVDASLAPYGDPITYEIGAEFLKGLPVEDWGCGRGWFRTIHEGPYVGVDGTASEHADMVADLREYRSDTPGVWMRHVIEHNPDWHLVLANALASARERLALILFTPDGEGEQIGFTPELGVPDLALCHRCIAQMIEEAGFDLVRFETIPTGSIYGEETIFLAVRIHD
jgi:hypothetical protein